MTSILTEWGKKCVEKLIKRAITEAHYVFCFTCIAKEFEEERARLEAERITLEQRVKVAKGRNKDIQANVVFWEEEVDKLIQEDTKTKKTCFFGFCPDCIWRYKKGKEWANNTEEIKRQIEKGEKFETIELPRLPPGVERNSSQDYISFKSRESEYKELLDALKDDNNFIIGLQGMGGTGKTTLAKVVGKELKESGQFTHVIDTTVSFTPDIKKIQDDIAGSLGLKWEDCNESDRPKTLWDRLTNGEKILLIMDDVWDQDPLLDFDAIGIPKRDNHKGCRVLVTTRSKQIFNKMNFDKSIELQLLSEEDTWTMFKRYAGISNSSLKHVTEKGRKIAKECKQLPVAIAVIARSLKGQQHRVHEWDVTLKSLKKHVSMHGVDDDMVGIYKCLKFSYDYMKDEKAKGLFLLCSVFPEDEEISDENLTRLCIGAGLFGEDYGNYDDARNQVVVAKNKLLDSCLLLEVGEKFVKMHDLIRVVAQWIANKEILGVNLSNKNQKSLIEKETNIRCLLCEGKDMDLFSCKFDGSKLETLIFMEDRDKDYNMDSDEDHECMEIPNSFFENIVKLRVLYLLCYGNRSLSLPNSFQSLTNIRSMYVQMVDLGDISTLGNLQSLETLDLVACKINELPSEIRKLEKFKLLKLENCEIRMHNPFEVIRRCSSLEELYFIDSFNDFCHTITLPELQRYHIRIGSDEIYDSLSKYVVFDWEYGYFTKGTLKYCMQTAEVLQLTQINIGWRNLMPEIVTVENGMNDLVELHLIDDSELQCLIDTKNIDSSQVPNVVYSKLAVLKLGKMTEMEELCNGPISLDSLNNLEKLDISCCQNLRSLFKCSLNLCNLKFLTLRSCSTLVSVFDLTTSRSLLLLETLKIFDCEQLESIITSERRVYDTIKEIDGGDNDNNNSCNSMFPKLKDLTIYSCPQLQFIIPFHSARDLLSLEVISIGSCYELKYIFGKHQEDVQFASLKQLELRDLPNFIDIFPESDHSKPSSIKRSSNSISKTQTQLEPIKSNIFSWSHLCCHRSTSTEISLVSEGQPKDFSFSLDHLRERAQCLSRLSHMCNIKVITLVNLSKIKSVFILSIASRMLLETLTIKNCDELKHIIVDIGDSSGNDNTVFPKLKELYVKKCRKLEYIFGHIDSSDDHQNHNLHLPALKCLKLCSLPSLTGMCTKNYRTTFPPLAVLELINCAQVDIKSIADFIVKELSGNVDHFVALERLKVDNDSTVESICCLNELSERQLNLGLQKIKLHNLPKMTCLFKGLKSSFSLKNLTKIIIVGCENLKIVFSTSIIMCLPQLLHIRIKECKELKHMIEDDLENVATKTGCFPKLKTLVVEKCKMLKYVFPISVCKELPELFAVMISEADELEEIFVSEDYKRVNIPKLKLVAFVDLPILCQTQEIHFKAAQNRFVQNCQELSLTSAFTEDVRNYKYSYHSREDYDLYRDFESIFLKLLRETRDRDAFNGNPSSKTTEDIAAGIEVHVASEYMLTSSQDLMNQQDSDGETDTTIKPSHGNNNNLEGSTSEKPVEETLSTISGSPPIEVVDTKQKGIEITVEEGTTLKSSTHSKPTSSSSDMLATSKHITTSQDQSIQEGSTSGTKNDQDIQLVALKNMAFPFLFSLLFFYIAIELCYPLKYLFNFLQSIKSSFEDVDLGDSQETTQTNNNQVSLNDEAFMKVSSNIEEQFPKDDETIFSKSKPTPSITSPIASQFPSIPSKDFDMYLHMESVYRQFQQVSKGHSNGNENPSTQTTKEFVAWFEAASRHKLISLQELMNKQQSLGEIEKTIKPSHETNYLEGSISEILAGATLSTISGTINEPPIQLAAPKQKGNEISFEEGTTSTCDKTITSSTHLEVGDGKICIPSSSIVNIKLPATKYVETGDSQETIAMEDMNKLIEEDPLLALEKLLTGVQSFSFRTLLRELKTLMDSSTNLDHLISNQESKLKLISLFHRLNQHQTLLPSNVMEFVEKVQNFFNDNISKHNTSQQVLMKHNQLLDSKTNLMKKLLSAKSTKTHIDSESSTANAQIHELSLQINDLEKQRDELKSVVDKCDVQKEKLKAECTEWAQQSKELLSALASTEVDVIEAERVRNLATESFANLKSSFPTF